MTEQKQRFLLTHGRDRRSGFIQNLHGVGQHQLDFGNHHQDGQDVQCIAHRVAPGRRDRKKSILIGCRFHTNSGTKDVKKPLAKYIIYIYNNIMIYFFKYILYIYLCMNMHCPLKLQIRKQQECVQPCLVPV